MGESSNEGPRFAKPFYTAGSHTPQKSDSCSKFRTNRGARTLPSAAVDLTTLKERRHPEPGALCRAKDLSVLRDAPPRRNNRASSTLPSCILSVVKLPP